MIKYAKPQNQVKHTQREGENQLENLYQQKRS